VRLTDTMWMRVIGVVSVVSCFCVVGCGDDDSGFDDSCAMGAKSTPNGDNDPCPQDDPVCPAATHMAVASCGMDGTWAKNPAGSIMCACIPKGGVPMAMTGTGGTPAAMPPKAVCGNGMLEMGEQCEANNLNMATCTSLMLGVGVLMCNKLTCTYDTSMCAPAGSMTGMGGSGDEHGMGGSGN
jgi:hypothetical protein